ncbi:MAG: hypothetical protein IJC43_02890, partial [Clostridia bacterium]|nr:hypothetical protein [Clostridia bacterium]
LLYQNGVWLAMASPSPAIDRLEQQMHAAAGEGGRIEIDPGPGLAFAERYYGCKIFNLKETESGVHTAQVGLPVYSFSEQERPLPGEIPAEQGGSVILTLRIFRENGGWVVEETAPRLLTEQSFERLSRWEHERFVLADLRAEDQTGTFSLRTVSLHLPDEAQQDPTRPVTDAVIDRVTTVSRACYTVAAGETPQHRAGFIAIPFDQKGEHDPFREGGLSGGGASSTGEFFATARVEPDWDRTVRSVNDIGVFEPGYGGSCYPVRWAVRLYLDGEVVGQLMLEEEDR